ncbi:MAG: EamA family transporter [Janthinobacterium lividum]
MTARDRLLALLVAVVWGLNFPATHLALQQFPPFLLVALRFALIAVPVLVLVPRPDVPWRWLVGYGLGFGVAQFAFLYTGMAAGMPSGLASLVLQCSAPFTVLLGALLLRERLARRQLIGVVVAVVALAAIGALRAQSAALLPVVLTVLGGLGWAFGTIANRKARTDRPFALMLWMSVVPPLPMLALSLAFEGPVRDVAAFRTLFRTAAVPAVVGVAYIVLVATLLGSGLWTWLLSRHPSGQVAPFSMAVPVAGVLGSWLVLGERPDPAELALGAVVVLAVLWGMTPPRRVRSGVEPGAAAGDPAVERQQPVAP